MIHTAKVVGARLIKNAAKMILGPKVLMWGLKLYVKQTDNLVDDNFVAAGEALFENDSDKFMKHTERAIEEFRRE